MPVKLTLPSVLAALAGGEATHAAAGATVGEVIAAVADRHPALAPRLRDRRGRPHPYVVFFLNGDDVRSRSGLATPVRDGDEILVVPAIAGG
jgi:molybdopterin converting factor small subunit